jgi:hypothetical protein
MCCESEFHFLSFSCRMGAELIRRGAQVTLEAIRTVRTMIHVGMTEHEGEKVGSTL